MFNHVPCFSYLFGRVTVIIIFRLLFAHFCPVYICTVFIYIFVDSFHTSLRSVFAHTLNMIFVNFYTVLLETVCFYIIYGIYSI